MTDAIKTGAGDQSAPEAPAAAAAAQSFTDRLLNEAVPAGAPVLLEYHQLDRRRRADLTTQVAGMLPELARFQSSLATAAPGSDGDLTAAAAVTRALADMEDLLATIAREPDAFRTWAGSANDQDLLALFGQFVRTFRSGEAKRSSI